MSDYAESTIPITVELGEALSDLAAAKGIGAFERHLSSELTSLLKQLGLSGEPLVKVQSGPSRRAVRIRVQGALQPYDPNLMKRTWLAVAPPGQQHMTDEPNSQPGFPDGWFTAHVANLSASKSDLGLAFAYLTRLVTEVIAERPGCLVGPVQAAAYVKTGSTLAPGVTVSPAMISTILKSLLNLGVNVANQGLVWQAIIIGTQLGRSVEDIVESLFTQLRSATIEVHVHPGYLNKCLKHRPLLHEDKTGLRPLGAVWKLFDTVRGALAPQQPVSEPLPVYSEQVDETIQGLFRGAEAEVFTDLGLQLPELVWVAAPQVQDGLIAIKINDRLAPPIQGLQPGELLAHASVDQLVALNVARRPATNTVEGEYAIINEADKNTVTQGGITTSDMSSVVAQAVTAEVKRRASRLLGVEDVEYQLAQLRQAFPALVRAATACFSVAEMTRVMRGLVAEGVSLRNSRAVLEGMLRFDTVTVPSDDYIAFDERLELQVARASEISSWRNLGAFVRTTLKHFIGFSFSKAQNSMTAYAVNVDLQSRADLAAMNEDTIDEDPWLSEAEREALRDSIWATIPSGEAERRLTPILTTTNARVAIRKLIAPEMPNLPVVAYSELGPQMRIEKLGTIEFEK